MVGYLIHSQEVIYQCIIQIFGDMIGIHLGTHTILVMVITGVQVMHLITIIGIASLYIPEATDQFKKIRTEVLELIGGLTLTLQVTVRQVHHQEDQVVELFREYPEEMSHLHQEL